MNVEVKRKLVYGCLLIMVAVGMMSFSYDMTGEQEANVQEDKVVAFPGAEGHGRYTTGGRGGKVYHVTSLEDDGSHGTLRWALKQNGPKTIVFDVAGTIRLKSELRTGRDNLTIAGQTSPGGICLADYGFSINSNNVIIRFLRFRPGEASGKEPDGLGGCDKKDIMVDHCSISWSVDECLSVYGMENSTVQWCIASEALRKATHVKGAHGYGGNWGGHKASYHHNLIAHCESRVPRLGPRPSTLALGECVDIRNNVFYNWAGNGCYGGEGMCVNIVNNYYKPGPATVTGSKRGRIFAIDATENRNGGYLWGKYYIDGNVVDGGADDKNSQKATANNWEYGVYNQFSNNYKKVVTQKTKDSIRLDKPHEFASVTTHSAFNAYKQVLDYAGCSLHRDDVDARIVKETRTRTAGYKGLNVHNGEGGIWKSEGYPKPGLIDSQDDLLSLNTSENVSAWPVLLQRSTLIDSDNDGMPDAWERKFGLNPHDASDGNGKTIDKYGQYTNLEMYMNSLVHDIIEKQNSGGKK